MTRRFNATVATVVVAGLLILSIAVARAAEPASRPYEITLHYAGKDYNRVQRTFITLPAVYESKEACKVAIVRVRVAVSGARLVCTPAFPTN